MLKVDNPASGKIEVERRPFDRGELDALVARAARAQKEWAQTKLADRVALVQAFISSTESHKEQIARDVTRQMGKPIGQARREVETMLDRARYMASIAEQSLADEVLPAKQGFERWIGREPHGVVLDIAAWNYPLLIAVNVVVPAVLAGNAVLVKHSHRTPLCGEVFSEGFARANAPKDLVLAVHATHEDTEWLVRHKGIGYVSFTGSVAGGDRIQRAAADRGPWGSGGGGYIGVSLELGGKDPAYVCEDVNLDHAADNVVDGAFYNTGQSCCAVERVYVAQSLYKRFLDAVVDRVKQYKLGDPMRDDVTLGPLAQPNAPGFLAAQVTEARAKGGRVLLGGAPKQIDGAGRYFDPCVVADANHQMGLMMEESFGPVLGLMPVKDDAEAIALMNDSPYGLTASVWTKDLDRAKRVCRAVQAGTVFMNRCDVLDPALPWVGIKDSGRGVSLSHLAFHELTRAKSYHLRVTV